MELYIFDKTLNLIGIVDTFNSLQWNRRYFKMGDFELQCPVTYVNLNILQKGNIIYKKDDIEAAYVEYRNLKQDVDGKEILDVKGNFLTGYLKRRVLWNTVNTTDKVENIMRLLVNQNAISPTDAKRIIPNLALADSKGLSYLASYCSTSKQTQNPNLGDELENLSTLSNLGHRVLFDITNKKLLFEVYQGIDRSVSQTDRSPCIFSKEFENVLDQEYTESLDNFKNVCLVNGSYTASSDSKDATPVATTVGDASGLDRYETALDSNSSSEVDNADNTKTYMSQSDFMNVLANDGNTELAQYVETSSFESTINSNSNLTYKKDFDLGDIVTCISRKWGITVNTRVTEVQEVYEEKGLELNITFGDALPTLLDKIKQKVR